MNLYKTISIIAVAMLVLDFGSTQAQTTHTFDLKGVCKDYSKLNDRVQLKFTIFQFFSSGGIQTNSSVIEDSI